MSAAFVVMVNDSPEAVALTREAAETEVTRLRAKYGEPLYDRARYNVRYIRSVETPLAGGEK